MTMLLVRPKIAVRDNQGTCSLCHKPIMKGVRYVRVVAYRSAGSVHRGCLIKEVNKVIRGRV